MAQQDIFLPGAPTTTPEEALSPGLVEQGGPAQGQLIVDLAGVGRVPFEVAEQLRQGFLQAREFAPDLAFDAWLEEMRQAIPNFDAQLTGDVPVEDPGPFDQEAATAEFRERFDVGAKTVAGTGMRIAAPLLIPGQVLPRTLERILRMVAAGGAGGTAGVLEAEPDQPLGEAFAKGAATDLAFQGGGEIAGALAPSLLKFATTSGGVSDASKVVPAMLRTARRRSVFGRQGIPFSSPRLGSEIEKGNEALDTLLKGSQARLDLNSLLTGSSQDIINQAKNVRQGRAISKALVGTEGTSGKAAVARKGVGFSSEGIVPGRAARPGKAAIEGAEAKFIREQTENFPGGLPLADAKKLELAQREAGKVAMETRQAGKFFNPQTVPEALGAQSSEFAKRIGAGIKSAEPRSVPIQEALADLFTQRGVQTSMTAPDILSRPGVMATRGSMAGAGAGLGSLAFGGDPSTALLFALAGGPAGMVGFSPGFLSRAGLGAARAGRQGPTALRGAQGVSRLFEDLFKPKVNRRDR